MLSSGSFEPTPEDIDDGIATPPKSTPPPNPTPPPSPSPPATSAAPSSSHPPEQHSGSDVNISTEVQPFSDRSDSFHDGVGRIRAFIVRTERRWAAEDRRAAVDPETAAAAHVIAVARTCPVRRKLLSMGVLGVACGS
jgi:hypothetical protein